MTVDKNVDPATGGWADGVAEDDEEALESLNRALASDPRTADALIVAELHDGRVLLRGEAYLPEIKTAAEDVAWGVPGVHDVENRIVPSSRPR